MQTRIKTARNARGVSQEQQFLKDFKEHYGFSVGVIPTSPLQNLIELQVCLDRMGPDLIKKCNLDQIAFEDMGESREYFPNHGYYCDGETKVTLNSRLVDDQYAYTSNGILMSKFQQTFWHEAGHAFDYALGLISSKDEWLSLSGWTQTPEKGSGWLNIEIAEPGTDPVRDDWWFSPDAKFTRFYAKRNPWDDFADSFSYYVGGLHEFLPQNKIEFFNKYVKAV